MPIKKSAKKALRQSLRRKSYNLKRKSGVKKAVKNLKKTAESKNKEEILKSLSLVYKAYDKAAKFGVIKKNNASRHKSRLAKILKSAR